MTIENKQVVVVIPVYKPDLTYFEQESLKVCLSILKNYPICVIAPQSLSTDFLLYAYGIKRIERFDDFYFEGIGGYNRLMLNPEFYERFIDYTYLQIYQLDAYVFEDRLSEWCDKGYDYIGAPWIPSEKYNKFYHRFELRVSQSLFRLLSLYGSRSNYFHTGNGGFSLRKTQTCYQITCSDQKQIKNFLNTSSYHYVEDVYWGVRVNHLKERLKIPHYMEALSFAFENHLEMLYKYNKYQLPFGAHAWYKGKRIHFWEQFIPSLKNRPNK